jgi:hypothetical protein
MPLVVADRVQQTGTANTTVSFTLSGSVTGFQSFAVIGNTNTTYYGATDGSGNWEVGVGTYSTTGPTLTRTTIISSSNSGSAVTFSGTVNVFVTYPSADAVYYQDTGGVVITEAGSAAALRVTNTGTGNSFVVEDAANPDSSPFVVDAAGNVGIGTTTPTLPLTIGSSTLPAGVTIESQMVTSETATSNPILSIRKSASTGNPTIGQYCSSGTAASPTAVAADRGLGRNVWYGYDGANYIISAQISASVDGTPGTNDMPGRLVFLTTPDGGSAVVERMRITSAGYISFGGVVPSAANGTFRIAQSITGNAVAIGVYQASTIQSDVTSAAIGILAQLNTAAASYTLADLAHVRAAQGSIGAGSTITNQYGFVADSSLIGATANYGFISNLPSGTNRWNFYAGGTADNFFNGNVGIGVFVPTCALDVVGGIKTSRTTVTSPATTDGNIFSGTYTPSLTNTTNIASSTAAVCQYMRVGNVVTVSGTVTIDPTATGRIVMGFSLPIASALTATNQCGGTYASSGATTVNVGSVTGDATNDRATFDGVSNDAASRVYGFSFTYQVL